MKQDTKKVYIMTFGCQMNERDSELVMGTFLEKGFKIADSMEDADIILFNTCSVRRHAEERAISNMGQILKFKSLPSPGRETWATGSRRESFSWRGGKKPKIFGMMGCTAEYYGGELFKRLPDLDFVCGTGNIHKIPELIEDIIRKREKQLSIGNLLKRPPEIDPGYRNEKRKAYVSISRGCNNYCSYCIVPYVRGPERSREPRYIINEVEGLLRRGYTDITLLGQNVNSYGRDLKDGIDFVKLLKAIDRLEGRKIIKFLTSHPKDASIELFEAMRDLKGISKHLHLPLQSGSDRMLKAMNRGYDSRYYQSKIKYFRRLVPECMLTTDIIVGFPGETDEDFKATKELLKEIEFDAAYIFKYSPRPPAVSSKIEDDIPKEVKKMRHRELLELQKSISKKKRKRI